MARHKVVGVILATLFLAGAAAAAQAADPSGDWTFEMRRGQGGEAIEVPMTLKADGEKLTGTVGRDERKSDIEDGTFKDGEVSFKVTRERDGQSFTVAYKGKLDGDTIKGTVEFNFGGESRSRDWEAKRVK